MISLAIALTISTGFGTRFDDDLPPARYRGNAKITLQLETDEQVALDCEQVLGPPNPDHHWGGCLVNVPGVIIFPNPCLYSGDRYADRLCHEVGHWNGWAGNHPR